ncbi:hypothetical protein GJR96_10015 [Haloferax sp. MBLA0076]|uniref:CopG family transcriptional regulator n=1 Tax=Haloferax litoreum TaxID=2666140 RepID=A0A6A8GHG8_9EURY|nr:MULTISPECIES: hypothetical protein [Haloferax]KAB1194842.1 hypothetical protein Hfx1148_09985 [Haloferax sp. CBA1148]MRX22289.1 hypothetical protein [Haloferax litoreum]
MEGDVGGTLPEDLREWVTARAEALDADPATVLARAVSTYRLAVTDSGEALDDIESVPRQLDTIEGRVDGLETTLDEKIDDVRMRVVQVKREADEKAPRDHSHPDLQAGIDQVTSDIEATRERVAQMDERVDAGFDNYEEILTYLDETTATLDENLRVVAQSLVDLRSRAADIEAAELERKALADLLRVANDAGEHKATCADCGQTVHLDLLTEPRCPGCRTSFDELSPSRGFFGSATLHTGEPPALEGRPASSEDDVATILDETAPEESDSVDTTVETDDTDGPVREAAANGEHAND